MVIRACEWEALLLDGKWDSDLERAADRACKGVMKAYRRMYPKQLSFYSERPELIGFVRFFLFVLCFQDVSCVFKIYC